MQQRQPLDSHDVPQANTRLFKALIQKLIHDSLWIMLEDEIQALFAGQESSEAELLRSAGKAK